MSTLTKLKALTEIVADTGELEAIETLRPIDATTNPSLLLKAAKLASNKHLLVKACFDNGGQARALPEAAQRLAVLIGRDITRLIPGRVSTEIDARLSFDIQGMLDAARELVAHYEELDVPRSRVLIKIAATWEGIRAAEILEKENIQCNLTLVFNMSQARACAEAGVFLISPFVGRIYDFYKSLSPDKLFEAEDDPGVQSVKAIYNFYRLYGFNTIVMGASFRTTQQVLALAGCDRLTISPTLLDELGSMTCDVEPRLLPPAHTKTYTLASISESEFRLALTKDKMATTKLSEGIAQFCEDQEALEALLAVVQEEEVLNAYTR